MSNNSKSKLMQDVLKRIPEEEKEIFQIMRNLEHSQKILLWKLIKSANREGVAIFHGNKNELTPLLNKRLIKINSSYVPEKSEISILVLRKAPYLMRILQREYH